MTDHSDRRILLIGDSYMSADVFAQAFARRGLTADVATVRMAAPTWDTSRVQEFEGDPAEVARLAQGYDVIAFHAAPVTAEVIAALPDLRLAGCARGGPVNIDLEAAREHGVRVTTTPGKNAEAVADLTIGFLISLVRNVPASLRDVDARIADGRPLAESTFEGARWFGREVAGLRVGLIGYGNVARLVAARARALGAEIVAYDPYVDAATVTDARIVADLDELLSASDVVSVHARATADNHHMIGAEQIALMPPGRSSSTPRGSPLSTSRRCSRACATDDWRESRSTSTSPTARGARWWTSPTSSSPRTSRAPPARPSSEVPRCSPPRCRRSSTAGR